MWTTIFALLFFLATATYHAADTTLPADDGTELNAPRDVTPAELDFINKMARHSAIAHCGNLRPKFNCTAGCEKPVNITLIQVLASVVSADQFRNSAQRTLLN